MFVGEIASELEITASTLSHHPEKLKNGDLVRVSREDTYLRYTANSDGLQEVHSFLYAECCTRNNPAGAASPRRGKPPDITP